MDMPGRIAVRAVMHWPEVPGLSEGDCACSVDSPSLHQLAEALGNAVDAKDSLTHNHSQHVAVISYLIALSMGFTTRQADAVHIAGHMHDIGKIGIPDAVLKKNGPLSAEDWQLIRKHPELGARIISPVKAFQAPGGIGDMILCHHERYDGGGYPHGLAGRSIPIGARIITVADTLSALLQDRPYRKGRSFDEAVEEIVRHSGTQFDPDVVSVFGRSHCEIRSWLEAI